MKPTLPDPLPSDDADLRRMLERFGRQLGEMCVSVDLGVIALTGDTTRVPHGLGRTPKRWGYSNPTEFAVVREDRPADERFLFLSATGPTTVAIQVW